MASLVIFDLDGTLADSFPWFTRHVNTVAEKFGFRPVEDFEALRHADFRQIFHQLEVSRVKLPIIARHMRRLKSRHLDEISLFPGVEPMLRTMSEAGLRLAWVSSDSGRTTRRAKRAAAVDESRMAIMVATTISTGQSTGRRTFTAER